MTEIQAIRRIVRSLILAGFTLSVEDGNDGFEKPSKSLDTIVRQITAFADECNVRVRADDERGMLLFVFGNAPEEVLADWRAKPEGRINRILEAWIDSVA